MSLKIVNFKHLVWSDLWEIKILVIDIYVSQNDVIKSLSTENIITTWK